MAAPLFFFLVGYTGKYKSRSNLLIYGAILSLIMSVEKNFFFLNILLCFILIRFFLGRFNPCNFTKWTHIILFAVMAVFYLPSTWVLEYGFAGLMFAISARLLAEGEEAGGHWLTGTVVCHWLFSGVLLDLPPGLFYQLPLLLVFVSLWLMMRYYSLREWNVPQFCRYSILLSSRYSLELYFYHLLPLLIYACWQQIRIVV